jgi:hypothetical protein
MPAALARDHGWDTGAHVLAGYESGRVRVSVADDGGGPEPFIGVGWGHTNLADDECGPIRRRGARPSSRRFTSRRASARRRPGFRGFKRSELQL